MTDVLTRGQRSFNMSRIKATNTKPELFVRSLVHKMGYRFRLHRKDLPGKPDLVFPRMKKIIFVHGCFWHMHNCRYGQVVPKSNYQFWRTKRLLNVQRDKNNLKALRSEWKIMTVWECEIKCERKILKRLREFLDGTAPLKKIPVAIVDG